MTDALNCDIQPAVEARIMAYLAALAPAERARQETLPAFIGQLLIRCLADEAAAQYQASGVPGLVVHHTATHGMRYVAADALRPALRRELAALPPHERARQQEHLEGLVAGYDPTTEAVIVAVDSGRILPAMRVTLADHGVRMADAPASVPSVRVPTARPPAATAPPRGDRGNSTVYRLPPDISLHRQTLPNGAAYHIRHTQHGLLGRLVLTDAGPGQMRIEAEVAGDPADSQTAQRQAILEPITAELIRYVEARSGDPALPPTPLRPPPPGTPSPAPPDDHRVMSQLVQCSRYGQAIALTIYADPAHGTLEDAARLMFARIQELRLSTWVVGPGEIAEVLKVYPERQPVRRIAPDEFNALLDALDRTHCAKGTVGHA